MPLHQTQTRVFDFSNPDLYNPTYIPLMQNKSEFLHLWGSAGSGKSHFEAQKEIIKSFLPHRRNRRTIVARKVFDTLRDSCYSLLEQVAYEFVYDGGKRRLADDFKFTTSPLRIVNKVTGVIFTFRGFDNVEKIKSIVGADRAWYEEATESSGPQEIKQLRTRLRGFREVQLTLSYNPIDEHHWINEIIHEGGEPGHYLHHSTYKDNIKMLAKDPAYADFLESTKDTDPNFHRVYALGLWGAIVEGLIYQNATIIPDFPKNDRGKDDIHHYGLDFGYSAPTALIAQHIQDALPKPRLINKQILYKAGLDGPALVAEFERLKIRKDILIIADSARPEMIRTLRDAGYKIRPCIKFTGSVLSGINDVRKFELCITAGSKETIREVRNYQKNKIGEVWLEDPAPRQVDHGMDAIRYAVQKAVVPTRKTKKHKSTSSSIFETY